MPAIADLPRADWHRLNRLLEAALALDESARSDWMSRLPKTDADLLPLVERLLAATDRTETADFIARPPSLPAEEHAGQRIGPYRLVSPLGEGGMGTVWRAERADGAFERQVALKLPHAEWIDRGLAQRFARERAVLASLNHPNIAQLFDAGWSESGRPYLALEFVEGQPILAWCEQQHLDTAARLRLFVAVVRAVAHAHAHLVVHRDLKPSNVLVTAEGHVKLLDFGIAKLVTADRASAEETELTRMSGRALTPSYAAPEQILGQPITTAVDIYALGVMLFELLTAERPYRLGRTDVLSRAALEEAIVKVDPATPSTVAKDKVVRRALHGDLDAIVLKALKKRPAERYPTAAEFADDLERHLEHRPVRAQRDSRAYRLRRFVVRNRYPVGAVSAVMLALVVGLAATLWQARAAREQAEHATTIKQFVLSVIQEADPQASQRTREADMALLDTTRDRIARELASRPDLQLEVRLAIATAYRNRGAWEAARQTLRVAVDEARGKVSENNLDLLTARLRLAEWPLLDAAKVQEELDTVIAASRGLGGAAVPLLIDALLSRLDIEFNNVWIGYLSFGVCHLAEETTLRTLTEAREVVTLAEQNFTAGHPKVLEAKSALARVLVTAMKPNEALAVLEPAYRAARENTLVGVSHPVMLRAQSLYGAIMSRIGRHDEGLRLMRESVTLARTHHGPASREFSDALMLLSLGSMFAWDVRQLAELRREAYSAVALAEPYGSLRRSAFAVTLAGALVGMWRPEKVLPLLEEMKFSIATLPAGELRDTSNWQLEALTQQTLMMSGEAEQARRRGEDLLRSTEATDSHPLRVAFARWNLVTSMRLEGAVDAAEPIGERLVADGRRLPEAVTHLPFFIGELAGIKIALGKWQEALTLLDESTSLPPAPGGAITGPDEAQIHLWRGQALLKLRGDTDAHLEFQRVDAFWREFDPGHPMAAEAAWWYGHSLIATGEVKRGKAMVAAARPRLAASFLPHLRPLATAPSPIPLPAARPPNAQATVAAR